eukprot:PLAT14509.1.p2 GENE.PLAT14509.1~~PLAT14509.1.p2  ORF type:complete len:268 (-),score=98.53 PLAT14509.1:28-714(-)
MQAMSPLRARCGSQPALPLAVRRRQLTARPAQPASRQVLAYSTRPMIRLPGMGEGAGGGGGPLPLSRILFNKYDADSSGTISRDELRQLCSDKGYWLSEEELDAAMLVMDSDGSSAVSYEEFSAWWSSDDRFGKLQLDEDQQAALKQASEYFKFFDADSSGELDASEFGKLHENLLSYGFVLPSMSASVAELDKDSSGTINFNEYVAWLIGLGALTLGKKEDVALLSE